MFTAHGAIISMYKSAKIVIRYFSLYMYWKEKVSFVNKPLLSDIHTRAYFEWIQKCLRRHSTMKGDIYGLMFLLSCILLFYKNRMKPYNMLLPWWELNGRLWDWKKPFPNQRIWKYIFSDIALLFHYEKIKSLLTK